MYVYNSTERMFSKFSLLKQGFNGPALVSSIALLSNPRLAMPSVCVPNVAAIDFDLLSNRGIKYLVFDKDNTLSLAYSERIHPSVVDSMKSANVKFPHAIAILSNSVGSCDDPNFEGAIHTEKEFKIPVIRHLLKKPNCSNEVIQHFACQLAVEVKPNEICIIGDRLLTDILFANQSGMYSILVDPINPYVDHPLVYFIRFFEVKILLPALRLFGVSPQTKL